MDRILIILKKENSPRASSAPALGLNTIIFKHVYWYMQQTQVSVYRTIGPLVILLLIIVLDNGEHQPPNPLKLIQSTNTKLSTANKYFDETPIKTLKKTSCIEYPAKSHFYVVKLGYAGIYLLFLFLLQNIDCGYSLEPPQPQSMF